MKGASSLPRKKNDILQREAEENPHFLHESRGSRTRVSSEITPLKISCLLLLPPIQGLH